MGICVRLALVMILCCKPTQIKKGRAWRPLNLLICTLCPLNGETFSTPTGTRSVRVVEGEPFTVQSAAEFERGVEQVEKALEVGHDFYAVILEYLVIGFRLIVKIQFIRQSGAAAAGDTDPNEKVVGQMT